MVTPTVVIGGTTIGGQRVNNLGLMQDRQNGLLVSVAASFAGMFLVYAGEPRS